MLYFLALHMHHSLHGWPESIGERGFPPFLLTHVDITADVFVILMMTFVLMPLPIIFS
jgi:hypothetical protein